MNKISILLTALLTYCTAYSQEHINPFGGAGRTGAVSFVINDTVYAGLGKDGDQHYKDFWKYSIETDQWVQIADFPGDARAYSQAFSVNGKGYVGIGEYYVWNTADTTFQDFYSYDPVAGKWTKLNDFGGGPRSSAVCFVIGNDAYIGTGLNKDGDSQKDFWKYDYLSDTWGQLTSEFSGEIRNSATAFTLNGKAYVTGGSYFTSYSVQLSDVQQYDPVAEAWTEKIFADGINLSFNDAAAFGYGGKGYICYGNKAKVVSYDPITNDVEDLGDKLSLGGMRMNPISFILNDTAYLGLGYDVSPAYNNNVYKLELPNPAPPADIALSNNTITEGLPDNSLVGYLTTEDENEGAHTYELVETASYPDNASFSISSSSLLASTMDYSAQDTFLIRVRSTNDNNGLYAEKEFTIIVLENILPGIDPFKGEARSDAVQFTIGDTVYIGLGRTTDYVALDDFWKYSCTTDKWERIKPFPGGIRTSAVAFTIGDTAYVGLGYGDDYSNMKKDFYSYNPATGSWAQIKDFGGIARGNAVSFAIDGIAYVGSGEASNDQLKDFWAYDPKTDNWTETSAFGGSKRAGASSFALNGKGYVLGGYYTVAAKVTRIGDLHEFDPTTGNWTQITDYNINAYNSYEATVFVYGNRAYLSYGTGSDGIVAYEPSTNEFENYGNLLSLGHRRYNPISFVLNDSAYFGLGRVSYLATYCESDIHRIKFPESPSDIILSNNTILEDEPDNTLVGNLSAIDQSVNVSHTFELFDNANYPDNAAFTISGASLLSKTMNYEAQSNYTIRIKVSNNYNLSFDKEFVITVENLDGVYFDKAGNESISVYPNPVESLLNISCKTDEKINRLEIYNTSGARVMSVAYTPTIDMSGLPPSSYQLLIITDKATYNYHLIVE
jgi:N-acetylneuraminic acid mutarotase